MHSHFEDPLFNIPKFSRTIILDLGVLKAQAELPENIWQGENEEPPEFFRIAYHSTLPNAYKDRAGFVNESLSVSYLVFQRREFIYQNKDSRNNRIQTVYRLADFSNKTNPELKLGKIIEGGMIRKLRLE